MDRSSSDRSDGPQSLRMERSSAHEFIMKLTNGYDTIIGENGVDLSGGQRQRLAIARAIICDPPILLLDDATAAVDPATENQIMNAFENASSGRTTIIVAHRLSTLRRADIAIDQRAQLTDIGYLGTQPACDCSLLGQRLFDARIEFQFEPIVADDPTR